MLEPHGSAVNQRVRGLWIHAGHGHNPVRKENHEYWMRMGWSKGVYKRMT